MSEQRPPEIASEIPWAMQVVLLTDKVHPASEVDACEATARAVVSLLDAAETGPGGAWFDRVQFWRDGRIRKLVRRARGVRWDDAQRLDGVTVRQGDAAARALVPGPVRPLPPELAKLQVEGTQLPAHEASSSVDALVAVGMSPLIEMTTGKKCAQCGHGAQLAYDAMVESGDTDLLARWCADGFRVRVWTPDKDFWREHPGRVQVVDAGFTELDGPTETVRAWW